MSPQQQPSTSDFVVCERQGRIGRITLNRPKALNALNLAMIRTIRAALEAWERDARVDVIVLEGAGERGFCAGGDITVLHESARSDPGIALTLWREEYALDAYLARYPRRVVALMDGIVMGGGVGLTAHRGIRIVTERSVVAMPEVGIGLAPDVGAAFLLARAPGELGTHIALTSARLGPRDVLTCDLADHFVPSDRLPALIATLAGGDAAHAIAAAATQPPAEPTATLAHHRAWIDACYSAASVEEIHTRLRARPERAAADAADALREGSPTALKVTLRALRNARTMTTLEQCLVQDFRLSSRFLHHPDLSEGIRAAVIDKDRRPRWTPDQLADVTDEAVDRYFAPLGSAELRLPAPTYSAP
jgi:enoyl-CoA hydratase